MITSARILFNQQFKAEKYQACLNYITSFSGIEPPFRIAETPIFIGNKLKEKITDACDYIIKQVTSSEFIKISDDALPENFHFNGDEGRPPMMVFDFAICKNGQSDLIPMLIEMQGFPSLFGFQVLMDESMCEAYEIPKNYSTYLNGYTKESYLSFLEKILLNGHKSEEVILLEWKPQEQKTYIDFACTKKYFGIETVCLTELSAENKQLYYEREGRKINIKRIFNRIIWDDLTSEDLQHCISFNHTYDVEWVIHPHWYYRISKYSLPFLDHPNIPESYFLNEVKQPIKPEDYVLKPLFSYGGQGVDIHLTSEKLERIENPDKWILQRKVAYTPAVETPDGNAYAELRLFYFWDAAAGRYVAAHNLARISKGEMIGTRYNLDKTWVGGSIAYFETK